MSWSRTSIFPLSPASISPVTVAGLTKTASTGCWAGLTMSSMCRRIGFPPHEIKGQGIYCFVTLNHNDQPSGSLIKSLIGHVRKEISPIAAPDKIQFAEALPKTRSGKIMRRILRKIAEGDIDSISDTTTLADPSVVDTLI